MQQCNANNIHDLFNKFGFLQLLHLSQGSKQNVGPHLRSKLFDIQIIYQENIWEETMIFVIFWKKKIFEKITQHAKS